jgi:TAG lipase/steryl ester hydrolase/phospholipase A2/LPA acyltransferase
VCAAVVIIDNYDQWKSQAIQKDELSGAAGWRGREESTLYDYRVIRRRYDELREIRRSGDVQRLLFFLHEGFHGNMAGIGSPALYQRTKFGTKALITSYINEMVGALQDLEAVGDSEVSLSSKIDFYKRTSDCFGRSALMLSGAGSLGPFHIGVVKALCEQDLLPNIISGASAGSIVAAIAGTRPQHQLRSAFASNELVASLTSVSQDRVSARVRRSDLEEMLEALIPDMTFEEALEETGKYINVSVTPTAVNQRSRLLNAIISPTAYIREAVLASCAIPGVFPPVTLAAKTASGERKPYIATRKWVDGSISDDLPARRLTRLYGVNHFISSQANPIVLWALQDPNSTSLVSQLTGVYQSAVRDLSRAVYPFTMNLVRNIYPVNIMTRMWFGLLTQEYTADINISPQQRWLNPTKLLSVLSAEETNALIQAGEQATWPNIEMIRNCTAVSRHIDGALNRLEGRLIAAA